MEKDQIKIKQLFWPDIETEKAAKIARLPALVFSAFSTTLWVIMTIATILGYRSIYGYFVFFQLAFFTAVTVGLYKMHRWASIAYLAVCALAVFFAGRHTFKLIAVIAGMWVSLFAVRGIYSYVRIIAQQTNPSDT